MRRLTASARVPALAAPVLVLALALCAGACDEGFEFRLVLRVNLSASPDPAAPGAGVTFTFSNDGDRTVRPAEDRFVFVVRDALGREVRRLPEPVPRERLEPDSAASAVWDQKDAAGGQVPAGSYRVDVSYRTGGEIRTRTTGFGIR